MKPDTDLFEDILKKYKLDDPLPDNIQDYTIRAKKKNIKKILKKLGVYTFSFGFILSFFFFLKKLGISLSIAKSAVALFVTTTITTTSISTGIYYSVKYIKKRQDAIKKEELILEDKKIPEIEEKFPKKKAVNIIYSLALKPFQSVNVDSQVIKSVTKTMFQELSKIKGKNKILDLRGKKQKNYKRLLIGRVEKSEESYTISVKIVDAKTKEIIYMTSGSAESIKEINNLSLQIAARVSKWIN